MEPFTNVILFTSTTAKRLPPSENTTSPLPAALIGSHSYLQRSTRKMMQTRAIDIVCVCVCARLCLVVCLIVSCRTNAAQDVLDNVWELLCKRDERRCRCRHRVGAGRVYGLAPTACIVFIFRLVNNVQGPSSNRAAEIKRAMTDKLNRVVNCSTFMHVNG